MGIPIRNEQLVITEAAVEKMKQLLDNADDQVTAIRVYVSGGGCSGMQYGMTFAEEQRDSDFTLERSGISFLADPIAMSYMEGAEIDYVEEGVNATFVFNNVFKSVGGSGACGGCAGAA